MAPANIIELDGRTGEGGGQLVRNAIALASVASKPVRIINIRGKRPGPRGGGAFRMLLLEFYPWMYQFVPR